MDIDTITEPEALDLFRTLANKFNWKGTVFSTIDIADEWINQTGEEITDEQMKLVQADSDWHRYLEDAVTTRGWEMLTEAVINVLCAQDEAGLA